MQERAGHTNKAAAAKAERAFARSRSRRRVFLSAIALFGVVFALLSIRLMAGLDPSTRNTVAAATSTSTSPAAESDDDGFLWGDDDGDEDDSEQAASDSSSLGSASPAPSTRAS